MKEKLPETVIKTKVADSPGLRTNSKMSRLRKTRLSEMSITSPVVSKTSRSDLSLLVNKEEFLEKDVAMNSAKDGIRSKYGSNVDGQKPTVVQGDDSKTKLQLSTNDQ